MSEREDLLQAMRTWAKERLALTDAQVIVAYESAGEGPPPARPFLAVELTSYGRPWGTDTLTRGDRYATARFTGFGREAGDWLTALGLRTDLVPDECAVLTPLTGVAEIKTAIPDGTGYELQFQREFELTYYIEEAAPDFGDTRVVDLTFDNEDQDLTGTIYLEF